MKALLFFEWRSYFKRIGFSLLLLFIILLGVFVGSSFNMSFSVEVFKNSPYTVSYMIGFLSLLCIFFATVFTTQTLFKERDSGFEQLLFATAIKKIDFVISRFLVIFSLSFLCFILLIVGFCIGQTLASEGKGLYTDFVWYYYVYATFVFGAINTLFCTAVLCFFGWVSKNKLIVFVTGLFLYIFYMAALIFSSSPIMAKSIPQSAATMLLSARFDPFGLSAFFLQTSNWSVSQRNSTLISLEAVFLFNRVAVLSISLFLFYLSYKMFSFSILSKKLRKKNIEIEKTNNPVKQYIPVHTTHNFKTQVLALFSFTKIDLKYIFKSIPFVLTAVAMLFHVAMEIYGNIEKGIRLPQKYASSGLMAQTIIENFHVLGLLVIVYYVNEIFWRSKSSRFDVLERSNAASKSSWFFSKWITMSIVILVFSCLMIVEGICFQFLYHYYTIDWKAYFGIFLLNSFPLIISCGLILIIQKLVNHRYLGLFISFVFVILTATSFNKKILPHPLLRFQNASNGLYSDMNGFGAYLSAYSWRYLFGILIVFAAVVLITQLKKGRLKLKFAVLIAALILGAVLTSSKIMNGYQPNDTQTIIQAQNDYEKKYRLFQNLPQPTIVDVITNVDLFPESNSYILNGVYLLKNKSSQPIDNILINFSDGFQIENVKWNSKNEEKMVTEQYSIISLKTPLLPNDSAHFSFKLSYKWLPINGHQSFNAIVENGSFMRISRYYPQFGYLKDKEIPDESTRDQLHLGKPTSEITLDAPKTPTNDFIKLSMTVSTKKNQIAIGVGELVKNWTTADRSYFEYKTTSPIPFRFAISSAEYAVQKEQYNGKNIEVYYHPSHYENVQHLIKNAKLTMDYCEKNFDKYPFKTLRFAEISSFTRGFAATAYPGTIYMAENMIFHANIKSDNNQDVINELAGHELSHIWWGNNQISPDDREGAPMLTETLAMYTEMSLMKEMYGISVSLERIKMHLDIYLSERGFSNEVPLYKVGNSDSHISYSKGAVVMNQLAQLIGAEKLNLALRNFLHHNAYPHAKPISTDFINEIYAVTNNSMNEKIDDLFKRITLYSFSIKQLSVKEKDQKFELSIKAEGNKVYEDGKGNRSSTNFNDSLDFSILLKTGKEMLLKLPIINNKIEGRVELDEFPESILVDPNMKFIQTATLERVFIKN